MSDSKFLPVNAKELSGSVDFIMVTPEAYVDHPSFGSSLIARYVESFGFSVAVMFNPLKEKDYTEFGAPNVGFLVSGGAVDSMVNNYTVAKKKRTVDVYMPGGKVGRPDRAVTFYTKNLRRIFPDVPIIIGGLEASLRRFAHYDYWSDSVMPSILADAPADLLVYGMGEKPIADILDKVKRGVPLHGIKNVEGTAYLCEYDKLPKTVLNSINDRGKVEILPSFAEVSNDKKLYAKAFNAQHRNTDHIRGRVLLQKQRDNLYLVQNRPQAPLSPQEMDDVYSLPFARAPHPSYAEKVASIDEVKFSINSHRGCFGGCSFCALTYHQGRVIQSRSKDSILCEAEMLTNDRDFKGYIHDVGGPTANFYMTACENQKKAGVCADKQCIGSTPCKNLRVSHTEYLGILREIRKLPRVKKVFIRSGIRFDYLLLDKDMQFFDELVKHHVSGQLKVAPEHTEDKVLALMNKPDFSVFKKFSDLYNARNKKLKMEQYLVPYLISSHPGCDLNSAINVALYLKSINHMPEQVQDFYPTPSTKSTTMFYTGINPDTMEEVYVARSEEEKAMQRALLQYRKKENYHLIIKALNIAGRTSLIGFGENCLVKPQRDSRGVKQRDSKD